MQGAGQLLLLPQHLGQASEHRLGGDGDAVRLVDKDHYLPHSDLELKGSMR